MKISDLRKKHKELANSNMSKLKHGRIAHGIEIKMNYIIAISDYEKLIAKPRLNDNAKELEVLLTYEGINSYQSFYEEEIRFYQQQLAFMFDYFKEYAVLKKVELVLFVAEGGMNSSILDLGKITLSQNLTEDFKTLLAHYSSKQGNSNFLGAVLSQKYKKRVSNFFLAKETLEEVIKKEPLLTFNKNYSIYDMFSSHFYLKFCGEEVRCRTDKQTFSDMELYFTNNDTVFTQYSATLKMDGTVFYEFFQDLKLHSRLKNELRPPMDNFLELLLRAASIKNEEIAETLFQDLVNTLGSWEDVEAESVFLLNKYGYQFRNNEFKVTHAKSDYNSKEIEITKYSTERNVYHFIWKKNPDVKGGTEVDIVVSNEEHPIIVRQLLHSYLLPEY